MIKAIDTETTGLYPFSGDKPFMISTYGEDGSNDAIYIGKSDLVPISLFLLAPHHEKVFHNAKFDIHMLGTYGMVVNGMIHDTLVMAHIYNPGESNKKLKFLAKKYLGEEPFDEKEVKSWLRTHKTKNYSSVPREIMEPYALNDARITYKLFEFYKGKGVTENKTYLSEMSLLKCLLNMERRGVLVDIKYCKEQEKRCSDRLSVLATESEEKFGDINLSSNVQLKKFLFDQEGLTCENYTPKGNPCLDEYNLHQYNHPIIPYVLEYRDLSKTKSTYLDYMIQHLDGDRAVHCNYYQVGARTGRFSCREPNLQNIPNEGEVNIRRAFTVRRGYTNYYFDYSQIELRLLAHYAKETKMIEAFLKGEDLHELTARGMFGGEYDKAKRHMAKRLNFGIIYGIGAGKFVNMIRQEYPDIDLNIGMAKDYISRYFSNYPNVSRFIAAVKNNIFQRSTLDPDGNYVGYVTDVFGRKYTCNVKENYKAVNYLIQGCAAGIIKKAMIEIDKLLNNKKSNILLTIHDELVIEIHEQEEIFIPRIQELMEDRITFRVPILINIEKTATNWAEKKPI